MFPIMLDISEFPVAVVGNSPAAARRIALLDAGGARYLSVFADDPGVELREQAGDRLTGRLPTDAEVAAQRVIFTADLPDAQAERIAAVARDARVLLNTEDVRPLCDFHVPSMVRRGDLLLTISTNGKSPGLARRLRKSFEAQFGPEWADRLDEIAAARSRWRTENLSLPEMAQRTEEMIAAKGWLKGWLS